MPDATIYVVAGFPRSGTSMLMRCLEAGGLECVYDPSGDANRNQNTLIAGYVPNPHGFYEDAPLNARDWSGFRGKAIKVIRDNFRLIPGNERLKVAYMVRDPAEIRRSYRGILSGPHPESAYAFLDDYAGKVASDLTRLLKLGVELTVLDYASVVADPLDHLNRLASLGWPIDAAKAASTVDPALYRHRGPS
jgi:hypothetical protein